jgi:hypothetical protein
MRIMSKKAHLILLCVFVIVFTSLVPISVYAKEPQLTEISFKNAVIDGGFDSETNNYTVTLDDNSVPASLEAYTLQGECELFVSYNYDDSNHQTGMTATVQYPTGSTIYTFDYSNPPKYDINSNNLLSDIKCNYGELATEITDSTTTCKLYIPMDLTNIVITPITQDINAYCSSIDLTLNEGQEVDIPVVCIASDSSRKEYLIKIKRVNKTVAQVKEEMAQEDYVSFIEGTRFYEKTEFAVVVCAVCFGIIFIGILYLITKRIALVPYDKEEKPFYAEK